MEVSKKKGVLPPLFLGYCGTFLFSCCWLGFLNFRWLCVIDSALILFYEILRYFLCVIPLLLCPNSIVVIIISCAFMLLEVNLW